MEQLREMSDEISLSDGKREMTDGKLGVCGRDGPDIRPRGWGEGGGVAGQAQCWTF